MSDATGIIEVRAVLARARDAVEEVRVRVVEVEAAMRWRSRAAEEFRAALDAWIGLVRRLEADIARGDAELAARGASSVGAAGASSGGWSGGAAAGGSPW